MLMLAALFACAQIQGPAAPVRYRFEARDSSTIDLSAYGQPDIKQVVVTTAMLAVTTRDSADVRVADIVIDSLVRQDGGAMAQSAAYLAPEMTESGKGVVFHLVLAGGSVRSYAISKPSNLEASSVSAAIAMIFPSLPPRAKVGDSWADTTRSGETAGSKVKATETNKWTLASEDTLTASMTTTSSTDTGPQMGAMTKSGTGTRRIVLKGREVRSAVMTVASTGAMGEATVKGSLTARVERLP